MKTKRQSSGSDSKQNDSPLFGTSSIFVCPLQVLTRGIGPQSSMESRGGDQHGGPGNDSE